MNKATSLYLDLVRLSAALTVLVYHFAYERFSGGGLQFIRDLKLGSDAVIVFFVLSGYVIAWVASERDRELEAYVINRLSRLWSVVIPALILTVVVDQIGLHLNPKAYDGWWHQGESPITRTLANLFFLNELWFYSIRPFSNGPFWSLGYEFWYYVIFAAAFFFQGRTRLLLVLISVFIAGPKILLLFPVWLFGVWAWHFNHKQTLPPRLGWFLFLLPVTGYVTIKIFDIDGLALEWTNSWLNGQNPRHVLGFSDEFLISYLYGILIAMHFIGIHAIAPAIEERLISWEKLIRYWAGLTFSIYLLHYPLLQFLSAVLPEDWPLIPRNVMVLIMTLAIITVVGNLTEKKKHIFRYWLRSVIKQGRAQLL